MQGEMVLRVERLNYLFGGLLVLASVFFATRNQALGLSIGVALTCLNFALLRRLVFRWTAAVKAGDPSSGNRMFLILPKMVGMMGAVVVVMLFLPIDAIAFLIGYSIFILSIVVAAVIDVMRPPADDPTATPADADTTNPPS